MINNLRQFVKNLNKTKVYLILANIFLVFFLITLNNFKVIPLQMGDFIFITALTLALALYRPGWAFLFFIGTIALENINLAPESFEIMIRPYQLLGASIILALAIRLLSKRLNFKLVTLKWYDYLLLIIVLSGFLSIINAPDKILSLKLVLILSTFFAFYYLVKNYIQDSEDLKKIIPFFLGSGIIVTLYGIWQNFRFIRNLSAFETMPGRPNSTFTEADWLGMFMVLFISVIYTLIYFRHSEYRQEVEMKNLPNNIASDSFKQILRLRYASLRMTGLYALLILSFTLLIITVSRSAWLGAFFATFLFLFTIFTNLKISPKNWQWKKTIIIKLGIICSLIASLAIIHVFHLTNFQLFNRIQSTGTGLQKITISCWTTKCSDNTCIQREMPPIETIKNTSELEQFGCRHINLEEIEKEKSLRNTVYEIYRKDPNVQTRSEIYRKSWEQIKKHPLLGIGWGSINGILGKDERGTGLNSSNIFLEIWLGSGMVGFLSFVAFWFYIIFNAIRNFYFSHDFLLKTIYLFIISTWIGLTVCNFFNAGIMLVFLWVFMAIAAIKKA